MDQNRCVRLTGNAGAGKSTLARSYVNFVAERAFVEGGIVYVHCSLIDSIRALKESFNNRIEYDSSGWLKLRRKHDYDSSLDEKECDPVDAKFDNIIKLLKSSKETFIFLFDNIDDLLLHNAE